MHQLGEGLVGCRLGLSGPLLQLLQLHHCRSQRFLGVASAKEVLRCLGRAGDRAWAREAAPQPQPLYLRRQCEPGSGISSLGEQQVGLAPHLQSLGGQLLASDKFLLGDGRRRNRDHAGQGAELAQLLDRASHCRLAQTELQADLPVRLLGGEHVGHLVEEVALDAGGFDGLRAP